jgi:outer membrane protein assembly factor BamB
MVRLRHLLAVATALISVAAGSHPAVASAPVRESWVATYDGPAIVYDDDTPVAIEVSPDGTTVFVTGTSHESTGGPVMATVAYRAATGGELWVKLYDGPLDDALAYDLGVSPDGTTVFVTGSRVGSRSFYDYATVAYDASTGARLWTERYDGPENDFDRAYALDVDPDGSAVYVTGVSRGSRPELRPGERLETRELERSHDDAGNDYATIAYDASTGTRLWLTRYDGRAHNFDGPSDIDVSPNGSAVFVTGTSIGTSEDYGTVAYDASTGVRLWARHYDGSHNIDVASAIGASPDGSSVFVTGVSDGSTTGDDYATVAYDALTGVRLWVQRYSAGGSDPDAARALEVSPDGTAVFVTGRSDSEYATVAYDAVTGARLWLKRYGARTEGSDNGHDVVVSTDGSAVYVTGVSTRATGSYDYATFAYDASTGATLWTSRYNGPGDDADFPAALGASPDGSAVFVTGASTGSTGRLDYATVAYRA